MRAEAVSFRDLTKYLKVELGWGAFSNRPNSLLLNINSDSVKWKVLIFLHIIRHHGSYHLLHICKTDKERFCDTRICMVSVSPSDSFFFSQRDISVKCLVSINAFSFWYFLFLHYHKNKLFPLAFNLTCSLEISCKELLFDVFFHCIKRLNSTISQRFCQ